MADQKKSESEQAQEQQLKAQAEAAKQQQQSESKSEAKQQRADKPQKFSGDVNHAVHMRDGEFVQGPQPKPPASGSKSVVVQTPEEVEEYPDGTHPPAPPEEQFWSAARVHEYNQLSPAEKNVRAEDRTL